MSIIRLQGEAEARKGVYYQLDSADAPIGVGGMGQVFKGICVDTKTNSSRPVAIKFMYDDLPPASIERARREASIQLRNDNLVEMLGFIETESRSQSGVQDETGAIIVSVAQGGLYGYLPVGTEVIIDLKDLYVGNYGSQAQVGGLTTDKNGNKTLGRLNRFTWQEHFKITGNKKVVNTQAYKFLFIVKLGHSDINIFANHNFIVCKFFQEILVKSLLMHKPIQIVTYGNNNAISFNSNYLNMNNLIYGNIIRISPPDKVWGSCSFGVLLSHIIF